MASGLEYSWSITPTVERMEMLSDGLVSGSAALTDTTFSLVPEPAITVTATVATVSSSRSPRLHETERPTRVQVPWLGVDETKVARGDMAEVSVMLLAAVGPPFVTEMVNVTLAPMATRAADTAWPTRRSAPAANKGTDRRAKRMAANPAEIRRR